MKLRPTWHWLPLFAMCAVASAAGPRPVARVLEITGTVTAAREGGTARTLAAFGTLYEDEKLHGEPQSALTLAFRHYGHLESLRGPFDVQVTERGCSPEERVQRRAPAGAERLLREVVPSVFPVTVPGVEVMKENRGDDVARRPGSDLRPRVSGLRPQFAWRPGAADSEYELMLSREGRVVWSGTTTKNVSIYPGQPMLQAGATYDWKVTGRHSQGRTEVVCHGQVKVATQEQLDIATQLAEWVAEGDVAHVSLAALWYQQQEMTLEALAAAARLAELAPQQPAFRQLLSELLEETGWTEADLPALKPPRDRTAPGAVE